MVIHGSLVPNFFNGLVVDIGKVSKIIFIKIVGKVRNYILGATISKNNIYILGK